MADAVSIRAPMEYDLCYENRLGDAGCVRGWVRKRGLLAARADRTACRRVERGLDLR